MFINGKTPIHFLHEQRNVKQAHPLRKFDLIYGFPGKKKQDPRIGLH